jgi:hypothetical protein
MILALAKGVKAGPAARRAILVFSAGFFGTGGC